LHDPGAAGYLDGIDGAQALALCQGGADVTSERHRCDARRPCRV